MEIYKTISGAALAAFAPLLCAICVSCVDENALQTGQNETAFEAVGELVDVSLSITVEELAVSSTKAEESTADADKTANDEEKHIDDLWVLEYDATDGALICRPQRVEITKQEELTDVKVTLADNNGDDVVIYVVANCGSGVSSNSEGWVVETTLGDGSVSYPGFMTIEDLEANTIPTPHPQRMTWDAATETYVLDSQDATNVSIPMAGYKGEVTVSADEVIEVHVTRMFAKLLVRVDLSDYEDTDLTPTLNSVVIGSIPEYCTVGTLWDSETGDSAQAATYADGVQWLQRTFNPVEESAGGGSAAVPSAGDDETLYPYVIYIPENIQGENGNSTDKAENVPNAYALTAAASVYMTDSRGTTIGPYTYTAYPGGNSTTNFNVRRNCVYRVTLRVGYLTTLDVLPSANCIVCLSGETTAFFPYCRTETGGGYDFEDYLYSGDDGAKKGQKIDHVGIIWQSTDGGNTVDYDENATGGFIGDNSQGNLVWIDDVNEVEGGEYYRRIYVTIPSGKTGNALIGAYNSSGDIIWSWHIWSRLAENDPRTVNTKLYYTYDWDETGIYDLYSGSPRVAGYTIMNCNLGAMQDDPSGSVSARGSSGGATTAFGNARPTFGTLYQWGRKDPFPPIRKHIAATGYGGTLGSNDVIDYYDVDAVGNYFDNGDKAVGITSAEESEGELFYSVPGTERKEFEEMIPLTIQNPTVFYAGMSEVNQKDMSKLGGNSGGTSSSALQNYFPEPQDANWLLDSDADHYNRLWGGLDPEKDGVLISKTYNAGLHDRIGHEVHLYDDYGEKSIFDPCPYGWRVSPPDLWLGFTDTGVNPDGSLNYVNYDTTSSNSSYVGMAMYMTEWRTGQTSFFPIQGVRSPDGCAYRSGQCGNYVNATADSNDRVNNLHIHCDATYFNIFEISQLPYFIKSTAAAVRCVNTDSVQQ